MSHRNLPKWLKHPAPGRRAVGPTTLGGRPAERSGSPKRLFRREPSRSGLKSPRPCDRAAIHPSIAARSPAPPRLLREDRHRRRDRPPARWPSSPAPPTRSASTGSAAPDQRLDNRRHPPPAAVLDRLDPQLRFDRGQGRSVAATAVGESGPGPYRASLQRASPARLGLHVPAEE